MKTQDSCQQVDRMNDPPTYKHYSTLTLAILASVQNCERLKAPVSGSTACGDSSVPVDGILGIETRHQSCDGLIAFFRRGKRQSVSEQTSVKVGELRVFMLHPMLANRSKAWTRRAGHSVNS